MSTIERSEDLLAWRKARHQLLLAHDLGCADTRDLQQSALEAKRVLIGLANSVRPRS